MMLIQLNDISSQKLTLYLCSHPNPTLYESPKIFRGWWYQSALPTIILDIPNVKSKVTEEAREVNGDDDNKVNPKIGINNGKGSTIRSNSKGKRRRERVRERESDRYIRSEGGSTNGSYDERASDGGGEKEGKDRETKKRKSPH